MLINFVAVFISIEYQGLVVDDCVFFPQKVNFIISFCILNDFWFYCVAIVYFACYCEIVYWMDQKVAGFDQITQQELRWYVNFIVNPNSPFICNSIFLSQLCLVTCFFYFYRFACTILQKFLGTIKYIVQCTCTYSVFNHLDSLKRHKCTHIELHFRHFAISSEFHCCLLSQTW